MYVSVNIELVHSRHPSSRGFLVADSKASTFFYIAIRNILAVYALRLLFMQCIVAPNSDIKFYNN